MDIIFTLFSLFNFEGVRAVETVRLQGLGATFPASIYENWLSVYDYSRRNYVNLDAGYDALGSSEGIHHAMENSEMIDFAGSDIILEEKDYEENPDLHMLPVVAG